MSWNLNMYVVYWYVFFLIMVPNAITEQADVNCQLIILKLLVAWFPSNAKTSTTESDHTEFHASLSGDVWLRARDEPDILKYLSFI